jgi:hypothetical protein
MSDNPNPIISGIGKQVDSTVANAKQAGQFAKLGNWPGAVTSGISAIPVLGPMLDKAENQYADKNYGGEAGTLIGGASNIVAPKLLKETPAAVGSAMEGTGNAMQDAGVGLVNKTVGALKNDFKRGANPGQGYFDAGIGPSMSMQSIADKASAAKVSTGAKLGGLYDTATASGTKIPAATVAQTLQDPLNKAFDLESGAGGMGNIAPLENYSAGFRPAIQGAVQNGGFTPRGLFDLKRGIAENTNWSDPTQFNLKSVRQRQVGGLSGILSDAVPETEPLNSLYGNVSKLAARAGTRAETGSSPLTTLAGKLSGGALGAGLGSGHGPAGMLAGTALGLGLDSVPVKTTTASGLFYGGKGLARAGSKVKGLFGP